MAGTGASDEAIDRLRGIVNDSNKIVAFSGAGLSAESASVILSQLTDLSS